MLLFWHLLMVALLRLSSEPGLGLTGSPDEPLIIDSEPLGFTQGRIIESNKEELTIDFQIMEGYRVPTEGGRIELFTPEGVMLPHTQDVPQEVHDLGKPSPVSANSARRVVTSARAASPEI